MTALPTRPAITGLPAGCTARPATPEDLEAVIGLLNAVEEVDLGEAVLEEEDIATDWASGDVDLPSDTLLVHRDGRLVAWAQVEGTRAQADVHPDARGQGIGTAVAGWVEARAGARLADRPGASIGQTVSIRPGGGTELLRARGYVPAYEAWILRLPPTAPLPEVVGPDGVEVRPAQGTEEEVGAYRVIETAFSAWPGREDRTYEQWRAYGMQHPAFEPGLLFVAVADRVVIGACLALRYPDSEGWVHQLAVDADHRSRGLGRALLAAAFGELRVRGETRMGLSTDSRTGALDLYRRIGMMVDTTFVHLDLTLG